VLCGKLIKPTDSKMTVQGIAQHMRCWDIGVVRYGAPKVERIIRPARRSSSPVPTDVSESSGG
jgi:hypothetical protein